MANLMTVGLHGFIKEFKDGMGETKFNLKAFRPTFHGDKFSFSYVYSSHTAALEAARKYRVNLIDGASNG